MQQLQQQQQQQQLRQEEMTPLSFMMRRARARAAAATLPDGDIAHINGGRAHSCVRLQRRAAARRRARMTRAMGMEERGQALGWAGSGRSNLGR